MNSAQCKLEIVKWCQVNMVALNKEYNGATIPFTPQEIKDILDPKKWKRCLKQTIQPNEAYIYGLSYGKYIERVFDNGAFEGDLRASVVEDAQGNIVDVSAGGE